MTKRLVPLPTPTLSESASEASGIVPPTPDLLPFNPARGMWPHHLVLNARSTWLTGDDRGFHSRHHRLHSSGDYKNPPPPGEHAGLRRVVEARAQPPVEFPPDLFETLGLALIDKAHQREEWVAAVSVDAHHAHLLVEVPADRDVVKDAVGRWKQAASHAVRDRLPGRIWASSCDPIRIRDEEHLQNVFLYILSHARKGAWVWRYDR